MSITIKDIAQLANVSIATVSRVLNNSKPVSPEIREKILQIVEKTGYQPNAVARSLVNKQTRIIGVMIPDISNNFFAQFIDGIDAVMSGYDYSLFLAITDGLVEKEGKYLQLFKEKQLDGIILSGVQYVEEHKRFIEKNQVPLVVVGQEFSDLHIPSVNINNVQAAYDATSFLISQGHRRIGFISAPLVDPAAGRDRLTGYRLAMEQSELSIPEGYVVEGDFTAHSGYEAMRQIFQAEEIPTAIFAATDHMAIGAMNYLYDQGLTVPGDVSIVGFDNLEIASLVRPALTTIHSDPYRYGRAAGDILFALLNNKGVNRKEVLPHQLIVRQTVRPFMT